MNNINRCSHIGKMLTKKHMRQNSQILRWKKWNWSDIQYRKMRLSGKQHTGKLDDTGDEYVPPVILWKIPLKGLFYAFLQLANMKHYRHLICIPIAEIVGLFDFRQSLRLIWNNLFGKPNLFLQSLFGCIGNFDRLIFHLF